ncbi:MAG: ATP12 family chaperone protein [Bauldia sp.]
MADDLFDPGDATLPMRPAERGMKPALRKRFYRDAATVPVEGGLHAVTLDGKVAKTPGRAPLAVPSPAIAEALAAEWAGQGGEIDPMTMPLTRLVNSAIDGVAARMAEVRAEIVSYAGSDLLAYRATDPEALIARQAAAWDPILGWAEEALGARLLTGHGVMPVLQPQASLDAIARAVADLPPLRLAATHAMMTLTGSAVLALAVLNGRLAADAAWAAAHVDEDWEIALWGEDDEAMRRRAARWVEMAAAARTLDLVG